MKDSLFAVHDVDLRSLLERLGLLRDLEDGVLGCEACEDPVSLDEIHAIIPGEPRSRVICVKPKCSHWIAEKRDK